VLDTVRDLFWSTGFAGTSLGDLTTATGLSNSSIYNSFGSKRDLFVRVFDDYCEQVTTALATALEGPDVGALDRVATCLRRAATQTAKDTDRRGCLWAKGAAELAQHDPAIAERSRSTVEAMEAHLARAVTQAQRSGEVTDRVGPRPLARTILAAMRGMEALGKAGAGRKVLLDIAETTIALMTYDP